jgi:hypothetical protein
MATPDERKKPRPKAGRNIRFCEYAEPSVRWIDNAECPICGGSDIMDALGMGLCVDCNRFIRPKKRG